MASGGDGRRRERGQEVEQTAKRTRTADEPDRSPSSEPTRGQGSICGSGGMVDETGAATADEQQPVEAWNRRRSGKREHGMIFDEDYSSALGASLWIMQQV